MQKHGHAARTGLSPTYRAWAGMIQRCSNPSRNNFHNYGGRGIRVCKRWRVFANFLADMGERPAGHTLDRKDNDGDYDPSNCRWVTRKQQMRNVRYNRVISAAGESLTMAEWAERLGCDESTIRRRIDVLGWDHERAVSQPPLNATSLSRGDGAP